MNSRESRRVDERRFRARRASDRDLVEIEQRLDRVEDKLNVILGGIAVVGLVSPIIITLLAR